MKKRQKVHEIKINMQVDQIVDLRSERQELHWDIWRKDQVRPLCSSLSELKDIGLQLYLPGSH